MFDTDMNSICLDDIDTPVRSGDEVLVWYDVHFYSGDWSPPRACCRILCWEKGDSAGPLG